MDLSNADFYVMLEFEEANRIICFHYDDHSWHQKIKRFIIMVRIRPLGD